MFCSRAATLNCELKTYTAFRYEYEHELYPVRRLHNLTSSKENCLVHRKRV